MYMYVHNVFTYYRQAFLSDAMFAFPCINPIAGVGTFMRLSEL